MDRFFQNLEIEYEYDDADSSDILPTLLKVKCIRTR